MESPIRKAKKRTDLLRGFILDENGSLRSWTVLAALLGIAVLSYGLYARQLGFYWDDWTFAWARFFRGLQGLKATFDINRPMRAYVERALDPILGVSPFAWQVFALLMRWAAAAALWWFLRQVWPRFRHAHFLVALFALVYPGFSQQSLAMTYAYFWIFQAVFFLSMGIMVWGLRTPRRLLPALVISILLSAAQLFSSEYLVGLELLRPVFIWLALGGGLDAHRRLGRTALYSLPFLGVLGVYFYWRIYLFKFPTYQPVLLELLRTDFLQGLREFAGQVLADAKIAVLDGWLRIVQVPLYDWPSARFSWLYPFVVLISLVGLLVYQNRLPIEGPTEGTSRKWGEPQVWEMLAVGMLAVLLAGLPFYVTGLSVGSTFENDRLTMPYFFAVSLFLVGLMELCLSSPQRIGLASLLAALAVGVQLYNGFLFRNESILQQSFAWQLAWRAPAIKPGTILLADDSSFPYTDDEALTFLVNWIYAPQNGSDRFDFAYNTLSVRLGKDLASLDPHQPISQDYYASASFQGSTDQALVMVFAPPSCLRILNPAYDKDLLFQSVWWLKDGLLPTAREIRSLPPLVDRALPLADLTRIVPDPQPAAKPPGFLLGPEPGHTWCYYFEKADLARQTGDWAQVARLGREAVVERSLRPADLSEYLIFIEADARLGNWQEAQDRTGLVSQAAPALDPLLCSLWNRVESTGVQGGEASAAIARMRLLVCRDPVQK